MRRAARTDSSQAAIVDALRKAGCLVYVIGWPCDLLVGINRTWFYWVTLECKTPLKSGKPRKRKDQAAQDRFLAETGTPVVTTPEEALKVLGLA